MDLLIRDAKVLTVDDLRPRAEAVGVADGRIVWVGDDAQAREHVGPGTDVLDAGGATVIPGIVDSHDHVRLGSNPLEVDLAGASTLEERGPMRPSRKSTSAAVSAPSPSSSTESIATSSQLASCRMPETRL